MYSLCRELTGITAKAHTRLTSPFILAETATIINMQQTSVEPMCALVLDKYHVLCEQSIIQTACNQC